MTGPSRCIDLDKLFFPDLSAPAGHLGLIGMIQFDLGVEHRYAKFSDSRQRSSGLI